MDRAISVLRELAIVAATVAAVDVAAALLAFSEDPGVVLGDPVAWVSALGRSIAAKILPAVVAKLREVIGGFLALIR